MKRIYIIPFILAVMASQSVSAEQIDGNTILKNMIKAERSTTYTAHEVTVVGEDNTRSKQIVYRDGMNGRRTEYLSPPKLKGSIIADNGKEWSLYNPKTKTIKTGPSMLSNMSRHTGTPSSRSKKWRIDVTLIGKERVARRQAYIIEIKPKSMQSRSRRLWIDTEKWIKLKTEERGPDGKLLSQSYYTRIDYVDRIPAGKFKIEPGPGVQVEKMSGPKLIPLDKARQMVKFRILEPTYLPSGYSIAGAMIMPFRGNRVVGIRYMDGVNSFTIFQSQGNTIESRFTKRLHDGPVRSGSGTYSWSQGNINLTLIGRIPADQIKQIAESTK
ncbi:MAG: sigma-E factor regulatory protein RseB domain-containing protein [Armatimonadota bacterium]